jgi:hypothetical protein
MKRIYLLLFFSLNYLLANAQCDYTFTLLDSFGDTWNDNQMVVIQNNDTLAVLIGPAGIDPEDTIISLTTGVPFTLEWNIVGSYAGEVGIQVYDQFGSLVYELPYGSFDLAGTTILSWTPICTPCFGTPDPGETVATDTTICAGSTETLSLQNLPNGTGITYQWYSSSDGVNYAALTGDTLSTLVVSAGPNTYYYCELNCSGNIGASTPVLITQAPYTECYCVPEYSNGTSSGDLISNVEIIGTTLSNNTGFVSGGPSYTFFTGQPNYTATLVPSASYSVKVSTGEWGDQGYAAWIDYNDDGLFSIEERIGHSNGLVGEGLTSGQVNDSATFTISLACSPPSGTHRLRIRGAFFQDGILIDPCSSYGYGETEDYLITITTAPSCPSAGQVIDVNTTQTTATISWLLNCSTATSFDIEYGPVGFNQGTGTLLSNQTVTVSGDTATIVLNGLSNNTEYTVYYRAVCGNETSMWSAGSNFYTLCNAIDANGWCESFDDSSATENCWTIWNLNQDEDSWSTNDELSPLSGNNSAAINTDFNFGENDDWLITPQLTLSGGEVLRFSYKVESATEPNDFNVLLSTSGMQPSNFTDTLMSHLANNTNYTDTILDLSAYTGNIYVAFQIPYGSANDGWRLYIDDVCVYSCLVAGNDGTLTVCRKEPFDLFDGLTGTFNQSGTWYDPSNQAMTTSIDTAGNIPGQFNYYYISSSEFCPADTSIVLVTVDGSCLYSSVEELDDNKISIYPNPSSGIFNLNVTNFSETKSIEVLDINGREVSRFSNSIKGKGVYTVDLGAQSNGIYFVRVFGNNRSQVFKVVKQ